ncbi:MAG: hypothetical protein QNJ41_19760 [Xenococcaceae cyanobacterium MO_188.B32]|nr:hypothetical protein [Xenococcaceae cyanobacterium MO_188.B32]
MNYLSFRYFKKFSLALASLSKSSLFLSSSLIVAFNAFPANGFQLDFSNIVQTLDTNGDPIDNNLTNGDSNGIGATMRFTGVDPDDNVDLVITTLDAYLPNNPGNNGAINTNDARINIPRGSSTTFRFSFFKKDTIEPLTASEVEMGFYDIDGGSGDGSQERIILYSTGQYTVSDPTALTVIETAGEKVEFTSPALPIKNPDDSAVLDSTQEKHSVSFKFNNVSEFDIGYQVVNGSSAQNRNFFFGGDVIFNDPDLSTSITSFEAVPFEFSPGLGLLLSGGGLLGVHCLKKKKQAIKSNVVE